MSKRTKSVAFAIVLAIFAGSDAFGDHADWYRIAIASVAVLALISAAIILLRPADLPPVGPVPLPAGATPVVFPSMGEEARSGQVTRWLKAAGDHVEAGESLVEVESDKVSVEMAAPASGVLCDALAPPGRDIEVGTAIAGILSSDTSAVMAPGQPAPPR